MVDIWIFTDFSFVIHSARMCVLLAHMSVSLGRILKWHLASGVRVFGSDGGACLSPHPRCLQDNNWDYTRSAQAFTHLKVSFRNSVAEGPGVSGP